MNFLATPIMMLLMGLLIPGLTIAFVLPPGLRGRDRRATLDAGAYDDAG
jgi:hypothetical protein